MTAANPTSQEIENARIRREIAARQAEEYAEAERLALAALGPGWKPWMKLSVIDSDHRSNGNNEPAAIAYKVYRGEERLTANSAYVRRMPDGQVLHADRYEEVFGELLHGPHPTRTLEVGGEHVPCPHYHVYWSSVERYEPRSAEQLAAGRVKRKQRAIAKEVKENPLFADQIREEELQSEQQRSTR